MIADVSRRAARDLHAVAQAAPALRDLAGAVAPLPDALQQMLALLQRVRELPGIDEAANSLPMLVEGIRNLPVIEERLLALIASVEPALLDVHRVREVVEAQQQQVTHLEQMMQTLEERSGVLERAILQLKAQADEAMRVLPDPNEDHGAIAKVRHALSGGD